MGRLSRGGGQAPLILEAAGEAGNLNPYPYQPPPRSERLGLSAEYV